MPLFADPVVLGWAGAIIGECIVPIAGLMRVAPGRDGSAGGTAQRACAIGIGESRTILRDSVEIGRVYRWMPQASQKGAGMVVGDKQDGVLWRKIFHL